MQTTYLQFSTKNEYLEYLKSLIGQLNSTGEYDIFLHQISPAKINNDDEYRIKSTQLNINKILKHGLDISKYGSIEGTSCFVGSSFDIDINKIFDYQYYNYGALKAVCIVAIPKYVQIDDKIMEFSHYHNQNEILQHLSNYNLTVKRHHRCTCLLDTIKDNWPVFDKYGNIVRHASSFNLPTKYIIGIQSVIENQNIYEFYNSNQHLFQLNENDKNIHNKIVRKRINQVFKKFETTNIAKLIALKIAYDYSKWEEREYFDENGW